MFTHICFKKYIIRLLIFLKYNLLQYVNSEFLSKFTVFLIDYSTSQRKMGLFWKTKVSVKGCLKKICSSANLFVLNINMKRKLNYYLCILHFVKDIYIYIYFKQVSLNDKWQERCTIFRDIRSISLNFNLISSLLILKMTKESHRLKNLFCELSNTTLFIIMLVLFLFKLQKFSK